MSSRRNRWAVWAGVAVVAAAAFLRLETLDQRPLWYDEVSYLDFVRQVPDVASLWPGHFLMEHRYATPPLHLLISYCAVNIHDSGAFVRLPSVVAGIASVALLIWLGTSLYDRRVGLLAGALMAVSVYHVNYSQEARPYALLVALTLGQYIAFFRYLGRGHHLALGAFVLCGAGTMYTHHVGVLNQLPIVIAAAIWVAARPDERRRRGQALLGAYALIGLLYLPQLPNALRYLSLHNDGGEHSLRLSARLFDALVARWGSTHAWVTTLYELAFVVGVVENVRSRKPRMAVLLWFAAPFFVFAMRPFSQFFDIRYVISAMPAFFLLAASGVAAAADGGAGLVRRVAPAAGAATLASSLALAVVALIFTGTALGAYGVFRKTPVRCSEFFLAPRVLKMNDGFCPKQLLLNSMIPEHRFLLSPGEGEIPAA